MSSLAKSGDAGLNHWCVFWVTAPARDIEELVSGTLVARLFEL